MLAIPTLLMFDRLLLVGSFLSPSPQSSCSPSTSPCLPTNLLSTTRGYHPLQGSSHHQRVLLSKAHSKAGGDRTEEGGLPPLFVELEQSAKDRSGAAQVPPSLINSIRRVKNNYLPSLLLEGKDNDAIKDDLLKQIVQVGIRFQQTSAINNDSHTSQLLSYPNRERVPGCIATVHLRTSLIPITESNTAKDYLVAIEGAADAMVSGGLLAVLSHTFRGNAGENRKSNTRDNYVTAADILTLNPEALTSAMGLQSILSRGRNDGIASMVRVVQRQIRFLVEEEKTSFNDSDETQRLANEGLSKLLKASPSNIVQNDSTQKPTVAMLLSGGVDSSVALHLLLRQNYNVTCYYLRIWLEDELAHLGECPWEEDLRLCQLVTEHAGNVPLETVSLGDEYRERVVKYAIEEAQRGRTPNPDIMCNSRVKFGCFLEYIEKSGMEFDYVASGHYARIENDASTDAVQQPRKRLFRAPDPIKDQSYFLCALTQRQLSKVLFPVGNYQKSEVRELAAHFQLPNRDRPDSQGLCFLGKVRFDEFLASYLGNRPGDVVDALNGETIGRHNGLWYHTVGQRKGIGKVLNPLATARGPWYVVAKDPRQDVVYVSNQYEEEDFARARSEFEVEDVKWISGEPPAEFRSTYGSEWKEVKMDMKIRHGPRIVQGTLRLKGDGSTGNVSLERKDGGLAPGQYVVFYQSVTDECLGAGVISEWHWAQFLHNSEKLESGCYN